jgi:hypothetical protein
MGISGSNQPHHRPDLRVVTSPHDDVPDAWSSPRLTTFPIVGYVRGWPCRTTRAHPGARSYGSGPRWVPAPPVVGMWTVTWLHPDPGAPGPSAPGPGTSLFDVRVCPDEQAAWARVAAVLEQADRPVVTAHLRRGDVPAAPRAYNATPGGHTRIEVHLHPVRRRRNPESHPPTCCLTPGPRGPHGGLAALSVPAATL